MEYALEDFKDKCDCGSPICPACGLCMESWGHCEDCKGPRMIDYENMLEEKERTNDLGNW